MLTKIGQHISKSYIHRPIFIIGSGRSGTSILLQALGAHPSVLAFPGESPFLTSIGGNASLFIGSESDYYQNAIRLPLPSLISKLAQLGYEVSGGEFHALKNTLKHRLTHRQFGNKSIRYWSAKTFPPQQVSTGLDKVYPGSKYLYIVRNGIDVVHSMSKFHGFKENDFETHCKTWAESISKYDYLRTKPNALMVRHEQLTHDPAILFSKIYTFLELIDNSESLAFTKSNLIHSLDQPDVKIKDSNTQFLKRGDPSILWDNNQRRIFSDLCKTKMLALGYDCNF